MPFKIIIPPAMPRMWYKQGLRGIPARPCHKGYSDEPQLSDGHCFFGAVPDTATGRHAHAQATLMATLQMGRGSNRGKEMVHSPSPDGTHHMDQEHHLRHVAPVSCTFWEGWSATRGNGHQYLGACVLLYSSKRRRHASLSSSVIYPSSLSRPPKILSNLSSRKPIIPLSAIVQP